MAFYNEVKPGDVFQPSANLHNDTVRLINRMNGISEATSKGKGQGVTVLKVYNPTDVDFAPGTPVNFDNDQVIVADSVPIKSYSDEQAPWGVLKDGLQAGCFGSCIVSGPVTISLSGEGKYAVPSESGFDTTDKPIGNSALILYSNGVNATICLGSASPVQEEVEKEEDCYVCRVLKVPSEEDNNTRNVLQTISAVVILGEKKDTLLQVFATTLTPTNFPYPKVGDIILVHRVASTAIGYDELGNSEDYPS